MANNSKQNQIDGNGKRAGFTLIEILVALLLTAFVAAVIYKSFATQQKMYIIEDQIIEMQQNLRAALDIMTRDIRMAGYYPPDCPSGTAQIINAAPTQIKFTTDISGDCNCPNDTDEEITYSLSGSDLRRNNQPLVSNIDGLEFYYHMVGSSFATPNPTTNPDPSDYEKIRSVEVTVLARSSLEDKDYVDTQTYITPSGAVWGPFNDHYRRKLITTTIWCRNLGL